MTISTEAPGRAARVPLDPTAPAAIDLRGLTKRYGGRTVLDGLDLRIPDGAVAGFVGPNGAGKTTTLRILLGLVRPTAGDGTVLGEPLAQPRRYLPRVGALIESPAFYPSLSGERNLAALAILGGHDPGQVPVALATVGLADRGGDQYRRYSLGMKQRLGIAAALLGSPDLLVLDEPTNGLDPSGIRQMRELLRSLAASDGPTVLVSSHLLAEVEQICDWLVVVEQGRLAYAGPADELMAGGGNGVIVRPERPGDLDRLAALVTGQGIAVRRDGDRLRLTLDPDGGGGGAGDADGPAAGPTGAAGADPTAQLAALNRSALAAGIALVEIAPVRASLEERYSGLVEAGPRATTAAPPPTSTPHPTNATHPVNAPHPTKEATR